MTQRKILYSPGFGAGWTTWARGSREFQQWMLTYAPIVEALERGEKLTIEHPAVQQFVKEAEEKFGEKPYLGGIRDLTVATVDGPVRISEYDGSESYTEAGMEDYL